MLVISNALLALAVGLLVWGIVLRAPLWRADAETLAELDREPTPALRRGRVLALLTSALLVTSVGLRLLAGS